MVLATHPDDIRDSRDAHGAMDAMRQKNQSLVDALPPLLELMDSCDADSVSIRSDRGYGVSLERIDNSTDERDHMQAMLDQRLMASIYDLRPIAKDDDDDE